MTSLKRAKPNAVLRPAFAVAIGPNLFPFGRFPAEGELYHGYFNRKNTFGPAGAIGMVTVSVSLEPVDAG